VAKVSVSVSVQTRKFLSVSYPYPWELRISAKYLSADIYPRNCGTFVPTYFRSRERKFHRWNFRSLELSLPRAKMTWNFRSRTRIISDLYRRWDNFWTRGRVKVACHFPFCERKFYVIFALGSESSRGRKFYGWNFRSPGAKVRGNESSSYRIRAPLG